MKKISMMVAATALALPGMAAAQPPQDGGRLFAMVDANGDGKLDKAEVTKMMERRAERCGDTSAASTENIDAFIKRADTNGDGAIDKAELDAMRKARAEPPPPEPDPS